MDNKKREELQKRIDEIFLNQENADAEFAEAKKKHELATAKNNSLLRILATNVYTPEEISNLHEECEEYLVDTENFDKDSILKKFADSQSIPIDDIHYLRQLQNRIEELKTIINSDNVGPEGNMAKLGGLFADLFFNGGKLND